MTRFPWRKHFHPARRFAFEFHGKIHVFTKGDKMQNVTMSPGQAFTATALPQDAAGNPALMLPGNVPAWAVLPATGLTVTPSSDGFSALINGAATPGTFNITVTGQNSNNGGISGTFTVTVSENPATQFGFSFTTPA